MKMVSKRRAIKSGTASQKLENTPPSSVMQKEPLQSIVNPSNSTIRELELLDLESSLLSSSNLPVLTIKPEEISGGPNGSFSRLQVSSTQGDSWIHLIPHSGVLKDHPKNVVYNYLYIPHKKRRSKTTSPLQPTDVEVTCDRNDLKTEIAQEAKREASVLQQISKLAKQGLWSATRLPKVMEPRRGRVHWDYMLDEARWIAADFAEERKWKKQAAKKLACSARAFCLMKQELQRRDDEALECERRKGAAMVARIVRQWWDGVSNTVEAWVLLANQRRWRSTLVQNKNNIAALTNLGPTWLARAINEPLPDSFDLDPAQNAAIGCLSEPEDADWRPPSALKPLDREESSEIGEIRATNITTTTTTTNSSSSCSRVASFESLVDAGGDAFSDFHCPQTPTSPFSCEKFTWGLPRVFPPPGHHLPGCHSRVVGESTERVTGGLCTSPSPQSTLSSSDSSLSTDKEEVQELEADSRISLEHVLEPYILNGWSPCDASAQPKRPLLESVLSTLPLPVESTASKEERLTDTQLEDECAISSEDHRGQQSTVDVLRYEASVPLAQVLPPGYQSLNGSFTVNDENRINTSNDNQSVPARQLRSTRNSRGPSAAATAAKNALLSPAPRALRRTALQSGLVNGLPPHEKQNFPYHHHSAQNDGPISEMDRDKTSPPSPDIGSLDSDRTIETEVDSDDGNESTNSICSSSASNQTVNDKPTRCLTVPPWHKDQCFGLEQQQQLTPRQLRRLALEVASLKRIRPKAGDWPRLLPSFGPICRIPFLPTTSHYSAVAWLHASYNRRTPACLLSPMPSSSDAELTLAAHLGQLAVLRPDSSSSSSASSSLPSAGPTTGDWGPHLIVCPHVLLPAWRNRLAYFCPGLRVVCIAGGGVGSGGANAEPAGTGRRLRRSITRGQVNICLTSFAALRSRPSRYSSIKWSLVILDQAQHLTSVRCPSACGTDDGSERPLSRSDRPLSFAYNQYGVGSTQPTACSGSEVSSLGDVQKGATVGASSPLDFKPASVDLLSGDAPPLSTEKDAFTAPSTLPDLVELIIESLSSARQRILIYSADLPAGLSHVRTLFHLLLTSANPTEAILKETADLVGLPSMLKTKSAFASADTTSGAAATNHMLSRNEVVKMLDPFIFRFEEDEEWDLVVKERIVSCSLSEPQRVIHDLILRDKSCERAVKSGSLVDLLTTMSAGVGTCVHPCLSAGSAVSQSKLFQSSLTGLLEDASPPPGPLRFPLTSPTATAGLRTAGFGGNPLSFCTTSDVLTAVRQLRAEQEQPLFLASALSLCSAVDTPKHLRHRLIELLPQLAPLERSRPSSEGALRRSLTEDPVVKAADQSLLISLSSENRPNGVLKRHTNRNAKDALNTTVLRAKRIRLADCNGDDHDEPTPEEDMKQDPESCVLPRSTGLPFISSELFDMILLEESAEAAITRKALKPEYLPPVVKPAFKSSPVKNKLGWSDGLETAATNEPSSSTDSRLAHNLAIQNKRLMCMQDDFSDWCSSLNCQLLLLPTIAQTIERHCSTHVADLNDNCGCSVWNVVGREFNKLVCTGPSALSNLLCVRDAVVATPPLLKTCLPSVQYPDSLSKPLLVAVAEKVAPCLQCLLPFLPSSRWLSRSASSHPRFALSFTASSGKLVALQNLLNGLISGESPPVSNHDTHNIARVPWRPRCIFLVAHRTTCLDLLQAWLACHPLFSALTHLRLPSDHLDTTAELNSCLERVNNWPLGSHGPLLVLVHARAPSLSLSGLRAGPDTRVVVLDADWRIEVVDGLRTKLRTWALNGLVDAHSPSARSLMMVAKQRPTALSSLPLPPPTLLQVYRLITESDTRGSIEACLSETAAVRLLPGSVFMTASPATAAAGGGGSGSASAVARRSQLLARVQPNVVQELLTRLHRRALRGSKSTGARAPQSGGGVQALNNYAPRQQQHQDELDAEEEEDADEEDEEDECEDDSDSPSLFQNREPLSEPLLNQAFEMHEAPQDVQALYSSMAENMAMAAEFHDCSTCSRYPYHHRHWENQEFSDYSLTRDLTSDLLDDHALDGCEFWAPAQHLAVSAGTEKNTLAKQMDITDMELWEVGHFDADRWAEEFNRLMSETPDIISFQPLSNAECAADAVAGTSLMPESSEPGVDDVPLFGLQRLPLWLPPRFEDAPLLGDRTLPAEGSSTQWPSMAEDESLVNFLTSAAVTPWGYSSEAMTEEDLPPVSVPPPMAAAAALCTGTAVDTVVPALHNSPFKFDLERRARATMSSTSSPLKRSAAAAAASLGLRGAGGAFSESSAVHRAAGGLAGLKRRRLTGAAAAAVAARHPANLKSSALDSIPATKERELSAESDANSLLVAPSSPLADASSATPSALVGTAAAATNASSVGSGANQCVPTGSSMQPLVISLSPSMTTICPHLQRLEVPRPYYLRDQHTRPPRLRRTGAGALAAGGSRHASVGGGALASGCSSAQSVLSNPSLLAKYAALPQNPALLAAGRTIGGAGASGGANQRQGSGSNAPSMVAFKFGGASGFSQTASMDSSNQLSSGGLSTGRPPEWSLYEEAGLFQCVAKLQNIPLGPPFQNAGTASGAISGTPTTGAPQPNSTVTPNFNLAEFFLNNYLPTRVYRSCRQCLLAFYKALATISAATTAMESAAAANICDHFGEEKPSLSHSASVHHGLAGRKVKNKLKSSLSSSSLTSLAVSGNPVGLGSAGDAFNKQNSGPGTPAFAASATISRLKGYQFYQYLQSLVEPVVDVPTLKLTANLGSLSPSPQQLSQVLSAVNMTVDNQSGLLRKCMLATLSSTGGPTAAAAGSTSSSSPATVSAPSAVAMSAHYRTVATASAGLSSSSSSSPAVVTASMGQQQQQHHHPPHHYSSILMHRSQHHQQQQQHHGGGGSPVGGNFSSSTGSVSTVAGGSSANVIGSGGGGGGGSGIPSGPVIHKNPTHIAALQEHNISPDTLITPAMVIKQKEEREARQRAEAASAAAAAAAAITLPQVPTAKSQGQFSAVSSVGSSLLPSSSAAGVTVGTGGGGGGGVSIASAISVRPTAQRSPGILPFSTASAFGNLHLSGAGSLSVSGGGAGGTVLRYATPGTINVSTLGGQHKLLHHQSAGGGLLRRVGPVDFVQSSAAGSAGSPHQQLYTVSNAGGTGGHGAAGLAGASVGGSRWLAVEQIQHLGGMSTLPARVSSFLPANSSEMVAACSGCHVLSANIMPVTASMIGRRSVTLTAATPGSSPGVAGGIPFSLSSGAASPPISSNSGLTVLASARSIGVGSTSPVSVYHQAANSSQGGAGVTLLTGGGQMTTSVAAGSGHLSQIIRPRHPIRGTNIAHKFVRTLSTAGPAENIPFQRGLSASGAPLLGLHTAGGTVVHRTGGANAPKDGSAVYHQQTIRSQSTDHLNSSNFIPLATRQRIGGGGGGGGGGGPDGAASASSQRVVSDHRVFSSHLHSMGQQQPQQQQNPRQSGGPPVRRPSQQQQPTYKQAPTSAAVTSQYSVLFPQRRQCSPSQSSEHNQKQT